MAALASALGELRVESGIVIVRMKAMILCAGYGTRLGDLTRDTPKPMLMLHGKPMLEWLILHLVSQGICDIAINLHFMPEVIERYFGNGSRWGARLVYSHEASLMGTAGGVKGMAGFLSGNEPFLVQYGDIVTDQDFTGMEAAHRKNHAMVTMLLHQRMKSNSVVVLDESNRVTGLLERPSDEERVSVRSQGAGGRSFWVNSAVAVLSPEVLEHIPPETACDLPRDIYPKLIPTGRVYGCPLTSYRCAIDSPERLDSAREALASGSCHIGVT